ncbi:MAG TPA: APC family permease [Thermoanaerobaculia bacterium]|nr:APC family permease [Thermoanaerobaculia bacterium]
MLVGKARDPLDPQIFHAVSLAAFLAWVGLGADGLSSSAYGPEEAFKALGSHAYLSVFLAVMIAATVLIISACYSKVIELFPGGGGGYLVATKLLGPRFGVVSGCALIFDYVLTISTSVASGVDQIFSFLPEAWSHNRFVFKMLILGVLVLLNLRGVKESVQVLVPIFLLFIGTHFLMIVVAVGTHFGQLHEVFGGAIGEARKTADVLGLLPTIFIVLRAYSLGAGAYTGIEAVSNGVQILREPRVPNAKRTMLYMALSLAFTASGIIIGYLLTGTRPHPTRVMNAILAENVFGTWHIGGFGLGHLLVVLTLAAAGSILVVAAQTGFLDGPRILANMAVDSWVPHRFAQLSDRLVTNNGIVLMGAAAAATLIYTRGSVSSLLVMYAINVFVTFSLTLTGMTRHWWQERKSDPGWKTHIVLQALGACLCIGILIITIYEKAYEGGWLTLVVTALMVGLAFRIKAHYTRVRHHLRRLDEQLLDLPVRPHVPDPEPIRKDEPVAVMLVNGFSGLGVHTVLSVQSLFPHQYKAYVFGSVAVIDSATFKGRSEIDALEKQTATDLEKYVDLVEKLGFRATSRYRVGTEAVEAVVTLCEEIAREFPRSIFYLGQLVFENDRVYYKILHNETAFAIQRRLQFAGLQAIVLPIRVTEPKKKSRTKSKKDSPPAPA